ncbi:MAG TPA: hypothetical protein VKT78_03025 [Fimbriimonadaceae bacterium]|nr:hypothetical protein [Fimbriimonadaceae bacterium]
MKRIHRKSKRAAQTLVEMVLALSLTALVFFVGISTFLLGMSSWYRGNNRMSVEGSTEHAVRKIAMTLRTAMSVTVDSNGKGLSYRLPAVDGTGTFISPATWDGVNRRIELDGTSMYIKGDNLANVDICDNVVLTDPLSSGGNQSYRIFTAGAGTITRSLTVMLVSQQNSYNSSTPVSGRHRETIYLRNIPQLNQ